MSIDCDLAFIHSFQQGRLRFWRSAVDFIGQQNIGKNRPALELEFLLNSGVDGDSQDVGRQHVAGKLHALKTAVERPSQCLRQGGFAHAGHAFDKQVPASHHRNQGEADNVVLAADNLAQSAFQLRRPMRCGYSGFRRHANLDFTRHGKAITGMQAGCRVPKSCSRRSVVRVNQQLERGRLLILRSVVGENERRQAGTALLHELCRPAGQALDALGNRRMGGE